MGTRKRRRPGKILDRDLAQVDALVIRQEAALTHLLVWLKANVPPAELVAFCRFVAAGFRDLGWPDLGAGWLQLCGGTFEFQPGDDALLEAFNQRVPTAIAQPWLDSLDAISAFSPALLRRWNAARGIRAG